MFHYLAPFLLLIPVNILVGFFVFKRNRRFLTTSFVIFVLATLPLLMEAIGYFFYEFAGCWETDYIVSCHNTGLRPVVDFLTFGGDWGAIGMLAISGPASAISGIVFIILLMIDIGKRPST